MYISVLSLYILATQQLYLYYIYFDNEKGLDYMKICTIYDMKAIYYFLIDNYNFFFSPLKP